MMEQNEKVIVQLPSTAIEDAQPQNNQDSIILPEKKIIFNGKNIKPIDIIDGKTLLETELPPIQFIIEKILPQGLFILVGSPKVGKSWLSLDICQTVSTGGNLWHFPSNKGTVLYLALEDSLNRLQTRLRKYTEVGEENLFFSVRALKIQDGLVPQVTDFIQEHPTTNLVIIDTMQHIRNNVNERNAYVSDYNDMNALREITGKFNVAMVLITHTRKMDDPDPLNIISGSTGLVGAVDGVMILEKDKRTGTAGKLTISNRDTEGHVFILDFDKDTCHWEFIEEEDEAQEEREAEPLYPIIEKLMENQECWMGTATELCEKILADHSKKYIPATLSKKIKAMVQTLRKKYKIHCSFATEKNSKLIKIYK